MATHSITQLTQSPYSQDFVPSNFWIFPKLKSPLKEMKFQSIDKTEKNVMSQLIKIPKEDFETVLKLGRDAGEKCMRSREDYFAEE